MSSILNKVKQSEIDAIIMYIYNNWSKYGTVENGMDEKYIAEFCVPFFNVGMFGVKHRLFILESLGYLRKVRTFAGTNAYLLTPKALRRIEEIRTGNIERKNQEESNGNREHGTSNNQDEHSS